MVAIIILAFALLLMLPLVFLPFISATHDTMEQQLRPKPTVLRVPVRDASPQTITPGTDTRQAA